MSLFSFGLFLVPNKAKAVLGVGDVVYDPTVSAFIEQLNAQVAALTAEQIESNRESIWAKLGSLGDG